MSDNSPAESRRKSSPVTADAHFNQGNVLRERRLLNVAIDCYRRALALQPEFAAAHFSLGNSLKDQGYLHGAVDCYRQALQLRPELAEAHNNLGNALTQLARLDEALACYQRAAELQPQSAEVHNNRGNALIELSRFDEAIDCCRRAVELKPEFAAAQNNLGIALTRVGRLDEAVICCRRALELHPHYAEAHYNLANALKDRGELDAAIEGYLRALKLKPSFASAHCNLADALQDQGKLAEAVARYRQVLEQKPDFADAYNNLGNALKDQGNLDEALTCYRRAMQLKPHDSTAHSNVLMTLQYRSGVTLAALAEAHAAFDVLHASNVRRTFCREKVLNRKRLRVGFVSHDLGRHPVGYFLVRVLENLDLTRLETFCYTDRTVQDDLTNRLQAAATHWRSVVGWSDDRLATQIHADQIDILFDLAGHTGRNRLLVFAAKPAPVQITWAGYVGTTGLSAMDYLLADRFEVPPDAERHYRERVLRMPDGYICYDPPEYAPQVSTLPALTRGYVTFGSFNYPAKITAEVIQVWSDILNRVPESRLLLAFKGWDDSDTGRRLCESFEARGIDKSRLELCGSLPHAEFLAQYQRVDLALDAFPYSGGLTTCESLWMGVPVITCPGETFASRHALSHLSNVGLTETIAQNFREYKDLAVSLAGNLPRLAELRANLRDRMAASPLCDGKRFARQFERLLAEVWNRDDLEANVQHQGQGAARHTDNVAVHINRGNAFLEHGNIVEAIVCYRRALELQSDCCQAYSNLGHALTLQGKLPDAVEACRKAIELQPDFAEAHNNLGNALKDQHRYDEAIACYRQALALKPGLAEPHNNLGAALSAQGHPDEAVSCCQRALELRPDFVEAHNNLGNAWQSLAKFNAAVACYRRALEINPADADAYNNLGNVLRDQGFLNEAADCCRRAAELQPDFAEAHNNLANALRSQGRLDEAIASFRRALELKPDYAHAHSNLLYSLHYREGITPAELAAAHAAYDRQHAAPLLGTGTPHASPCHDRPRLRVGFVSPNLGRHPVGYFLVRVLENLNQERLETICYSDRVLTHDLTSRLKSAATEWRDVVGLSDEQLAAQIRADGIDILFDLAGHTGNNRLLVFARKPAPVQITWIGYEGTTGLEAMDYLLVDRHVVPPGSEGHHRERVVRMPDGYLCYDPPANAPPVGPLPALATGRVTFGCFNNLAKITPAVVGVWAAILQKVPTSRLVMRYRGLGDAAVRKRYLDLFAARGIDPQRVELQPWTSYADYLAAYQQVDLGLDPFPFTGGTVTCESLWMGVPVVTCPGETFASRHSLSHLSHVGLVEMIAADRRDYVERAVSLAGDLPRLADIRSGLRERMAASPLCDGKRFAAHFESLLLDLGSRFMSEQGAVALARGDLSGAEACYRRALELKPDFAIAHASLGNVLKALGQIDKAVESYLHALAIQPDAPIVHNNLAVVRTSQGKLGEAIASYRRALELQPDFVQAHSNLLYTLNFCPDVEPAAVYAEHRQWNSLHAAPLAKTIAPHGNTRSSDRQLRVGYVSPDFSQHPVGIFLLPLLAHHDRRNFDLFCYSSVTRPDEITASCRALCHQWRDVRTNTDEQVAQIIRDDQIDILVDLTMHMPGNRLLAFARKPAPVQITYLAYCGTTGLDAMDYRLTDPCLDPPVDPVVDPVALQCCYYSEESIYLPESYWCYPDRGEVPAVAPLPSTRSGFTTFGCLNNFCKITAPTQEVWIRLLQAMPDSRLLLHAHPGAHRNQLCELFAQQGISVERLEFIGYQPTVEYLQTYDRIDIALDPFPLGGGTTTCDALWMGVPVVTLAGRTALGRGGLSILSTLELNELVAHDRDAYVQIALDLARDKSRLNTLRQGLRERIRNSPLMNAPRFARHVEAAYRDVWQRWCGQTR